jgi:uncharacterized protein (DUF1501 family)
MRFNVEAAMQKKIARREFLNLAGRTLAGSALLASMGRISAVSAASTNGYKALVCLYMNGGNDGFNWLVPITSAAHATYANSRTNLAIGASAPLALNGTASDGNTYGIHPSCPDLKTLFNNGKAAFVCNVGPLIQPTTLAQAQAGSVALPPQLFSHVDQATEWMTAYPQSPNRYGWAGRIADVLTAQGTSANLAFNIDVGGTNYWQGGQTTNPYVLGVSGAPVTNIFGNQYYRGGARGTMAKTLLNLGEGDSNLLVAEHSAIWQNAINKVAMVNSALAAAGDLTTAFPAAATAGNDWNLSQQLHEVARVIKAQSQIGDARQIFFVQMGGFDTHNSELTTQSQLLGWVSQYVNVFYNAMIELGQQNNVTLFTMSDFGRTLQANSDGADHGWGNHQMIVGGAVKGGYYGQMPSWALGGANDFGLGRMVPTTSCDQYAATMASWFGLSASDLASVFPNLSNFSSSNLGFLG